MQILAENYTLSTDVPTLMKSQEDFEKKSDSFSMPERVSVTAISFVPDITADFIQLRNAPGMYYVSETLRNELIQEGCTGISFKETEE